MMLTRGNLLKTATPLATLLADPPKDWAHSNYPRDTPETRTIRLGITALTDNAPIVMAHELGSFKKFGIESVISKEATSAVIRDKLTLGENQAIHMLLGMPFASSLGLFGSPTKPIVIRWLLNRSAVRVRPDPVDDRRTGGEVR